MKFQFIDTHRTHFKITIMCNVLNVSSSGYYDWRDRSGSDREKRHQNLTKKIKKFHKASNEIYGSPRIHGDLIDDGERVGVNTVALLMKRNGVQSKVHKRFVVTTDSRHNLKAAPNLLKRNFSSEDLNEKWVSDVSFIATREGFLYLATVMDLYSRLIVGWSMGNSNTIVLIKDALTMALDRRGKVDGVILHSDRGVQYSSTDYQSFLRSNGIICSMSRKGNCWDNAVMESFYHSLKTEWVRFEDYRTRAQAKSSIFEYIEIFYNRQRRHSTLGNRSPMAFETIGAH